MRSSYSTTSRLAKRPATVFGLSVLAICLSAITVVQAQPIGSLGFADLGGTTANTVSVNTATSFTFGNLVSALDGTGVFAGLPVQFYGTVPFNTTSPTGLTFGNSEFGHFASTSISQISNVPGVPAFLVLGQWTPGTFGNVQGGPFPADVKVSFTQVAPGTAISASFTFATPPASEEIPEPSTIVMFLTGLPGAVTMYRLRRRRGYLATA